MVYPRISHRLLNAIILIISVIGILFLFHGFFNLLKGINLPVDLALRYWQTKQLLVDQINIYETQVHAQYPPSFFFFLVPFLASSSYSTVSIIWALVNLMGLGLISAYVFQNTNRSSIEKWLLVSSFLAFHSIAHGLGVGQVHVFILTNLCIYLWIYNANSPSIWLKAIGVIALSISLGKYSLSIPFAILFLLLPKYRVSTTLAIGINSILSHFVLIRVESTIPQYLAIILKNASVVQSLGTIDMQALSNYLAIPSPFNSVLILTAIVLFVVILIKFKPKLDVQLALAAVTARLFIYHAHYDNVILLFLLIAIWNRITNFNQVSKELILFGLLVFSLMIPARYLEFTSPTCGIFLLFQLTIWIFTVTFLVMKPTKKPIEDPC